MSRRTGRSVALTVLAVVLPLVAQGAEPGGLTLPRCSPLPPYFCADAAYFLADTTCVVEVYFTVCNDALQFVKTGDGYAASADLSVVLRNGKSEQIAGDTYRINLRSATYKETVSPDSCRTEVVRFRAAKGDFRMVLGLYDRDSRAKSLAEAELKIPVLTGVPSLSDLEFLEPAPGVYEDARRGFGPKVRRVYGTQGDSIRFYFEVYHPASADTLQVVEQVYGASGVKAFETSRLSAGAGRVTHLDAIPSDSLASGRYTLKVVLKSADGKVAVTRSKDFELRRETFYSSRDLDEAVAILTYIATGSQIDAFIKASEEERKKLWEEFWREKDPTPGTPRNEFMEEHLRRFRYANEHFGVPNTAGWKTDRGRIYILYGEPDDIESYPFEMGRKPTEVWNYYQKGRRFVFVDETGFGDYVLEGN